MRQERLTSQRQSLSGDQINTGGGSTTRVNTHTCNRGFVVLLSCSFCLLQRLLHYLSILPRHRHLYLTLHTPARFLGATSRVPQPDLLFISVGCILNIPEIAPNYRYVRYAFKTR